MFARLFIRELIGLRACPSAARPIGERNAFLGAGARVQGNILNLSDDSLSFSVVRSSSKSNVRPSRAPLTLTPSAVNKIRLLLEEKPEYIGLKVGVKMRGCNGLTYTLDYTKEKLKSDEEVLQDAGNWVSSEVTSDTRPRPMVFVSRRCEGVHRQESSADPSGTVMHFTETKLSSEFIFNNPNIKGMCGCGESFYV
ncbi:Iron-sulfur cluster assembly 1 -like protein, mitochondrial HESB-like domain-containing protein 2 [Takifugu flavidus]|uniref:Iron-sulfur cluster assembly 1-like protein, mitochondrial HESB-like domain-containing protein 2 n=1 Tax=Takifugu flavidus TaxID=433684 RepID=A0A5C6N3J7_9TELE|nr:Iron-sulfur cluster assembly 1 -like protein, mitochondrial HESB-like domain-containing protein 2 [Takifugu flavidus]